MLFSSFAGEDLCRRVPSPAVAEGTPNMEPRHALDRVPWLWHPGMPEGTPGHVLFRLPLSVRRAGKAVIQVSADMCFCLALDGTVVARGPDTGDLTHWSFATYELTLRPGRHRLEALVWWDRTPTAPEARITLRGGFACAGLGAADALFSTGKAPWRVARMEGITWSQTTNRSYHVIGESALVDLGRFDPAKARWLPPSVVRAPIEAALTGIVGPGWQLRPSGLPEQRHDTWRGGRVRGRLARWSAAPMLKFGAEAEPGVEPRWEALLSGKRSLRLPAGYEATLLVDTDDYLCGFPTLEFSGGAGTRVRWEWAEALYLTTNTAGHKGDRGAVAGKYFAGFGDTWILGGKGRRTTCSPWWRSGRYWLLSIKVGRVPAVLHGLSVERTGFPIRYRARFESDDPSFGPVLDLCERGLRSCMHEVFVDCPYYEQMMYVADTRIQMLVAYVLSGDDRLPRRGMELFDLSRGRRGYPTMRHPSVLRQESATFAMIWPWMLRDFALWRDDPAWLRGRLPGLRALVEALRTEEDADGLLVRPPGWLFADWVPEWHVGWPPGAYEGRRSSIINLQYLLTLQAAADVETWVGDPAVGGGLAGRASRLAKAIGRTFWNARRGLWADDTSAKAFSQHAQVLAILGGLRAPAVSRWADAKSNGLAAATIYFQHYLFEALGRVGRTDILVERLDMWKGLVKTGFKTPVEMPEPGRSDCHAWGAHPAFHLHATVAGVRPSSPGFRTVRIAPQPGPLRRIETSVPHPRGSIRLKLAFNRGWLDGEINLPRGVAGTLVWGGRERALKPGPQSLRVGS
jgi:alpha-L-rhamnosidase